MSPRAHLIDNGPVVFEGVLAQSLAARDIAMKSVPANDIGRTGQRNLLVARRQRHKRRSARS